MVLFLPWILTLEFLRHHRRRVQSWNGRSSRAEDSVSGHQPAIQYTTREYCKKYEKEYSQDGLRSRAALHTSITRLLYI